MNFLDPYETMLKDGIDHFLAKFHEGCSDFSGLATIFFRLMQGMQDPPLEFIWFSSALTFHTSKTPNQEFTKEFLIFKDLFHSLTSLNTNPSDGLKKISILAPLMFRLYNLMCGFPGFRVEIEGFVDSFVSYIVLASCGNLEEKGSGFDNSGMCFLDLIPVWTVDREWVNSGYRDDLRLFFPVLSDDTRCGINADCKIGYLAGVVMIEAFLLMLCLRFGSGLSREELHKNVQSSASQIIKGFSKHWIFLDMLLRMLLEPSLPISNLLTSEDELILRQALFDAVLLPEENTFLSKSKSSHLPDGCFRNLVLLWLFVAETAMHFTRDNGNDTKTAHYLGAFSKSPLPNQLIDWTIHQSSMKLTIPYNSTPEAIIDWLLAAENKGVKVSDLSIRELHAKVRSKPKGEEENECCKSDHEMVDSLDGTYSSPRTKRCGRRKHEERIINREEEERRESKLFKYDDGLSIGSDVYNPTQGSLTSDEDMEAS